MKRHVLTFGAAALAIAVLAASFYYSLQYAAPWARSWDEVDFALALDRFDLLAMQPHFPGYPYYILGGLFLHRWISDPVLALSAFNAAMALLSALPITLLARRVVGLPSGLLIAALLSTTPYLWLMAARPMSECAGIAALWWCLWSVRESLERPESRARHLVALVCFSLLMGIRLSFFPFGLLLVLLWGRRYRASKTSNSIRNRRLLASVGAAGLLQLIWVGGLAMSEGSPAGFWKLSAAFVEGHFSEWGGGVVATPMPFLERVLHLFGSNLIGDAMLARSTGAGGLLLALIVLLAVAWRMQKKAGVGESYSASQPASNSSASNDRRFFIWLAGAAAFYALWALFGQNIEKPRHIAPIVGPLLFLLYVGVFRTGAAYWQSRRLALMPIALFATAISLLSLQLVHGERLLQQQAGEEPAVYQLHRYLESQTTPFRLYTWEETRVLQYAGAEYEHARIYTYPYFRSAAEGLEGRRILLTDHVVGGFRSQGYDISSQLREVAEFRSNSLFEPVYSRIKLYEYRE
ncbi:hypothetical protein [Paenibacillus koleovorans]|uniref:hypothetical protein n=1 Tax=Paenibacillus koleovorans TaxID=121608 RepID=UPI000FDB9254|nr:hypothetical protein [Paenibacillus koleovorans]